MRKLFSTALCMGMLAISTRAGLAQAPPAVRQDTLRKGDVVRLWIWREEDMSGDFPVPDNGIVVFPKIGPIKVTDRATEDLKQAVVTEYQKYLRNTSIELTFLFQVTVLGAVNKPGVYPLDKAMSIANALALAEGTRPEGKSNEVQLIRDGTKLVANISQRTRIADLPIRSGDQLFVPERSWASRNTPLVAALVSGLVSVAIAVIVQNSNND